MEEPLFECIYTDSEEILHEAYRNVHCKQQVHLGYYCLICAACVLLLSSILQYSTWVVFVVLLTVLGMWFLAYPKFRARRIIEEDLRINHGQIPTATLTITDKLTHSYKLSTSSILFEDILEVYFLKRSIVFRSLEFFVTIDRNGFVKGTPAELEQYLREKCSEAIIIHKD